jgi:hypothetical protein
MDDPRELTETEVRDNFLELCYGYIRFWEELPEKSLHERMAGVVFSILVMLDGESADLPSFIVAPFPHPDDKEYNRLHGENWYPQNLEQNINCNIAGGLHEYFCMMKNK